MAKKRRNGVRGAGRELGLRPLHLLPAPAQQPLPPVAPDPPAVGVDRLLRVIMAGVRTAPVINIGTATLAAFIGAGGLGDPIVAGLGRSRW